MEILYFYFSLIIGIYSFFLFSFKHPHLVQLSLPSFPYFPSSPLFSLSTPRSFPLSCPFPLTSLPFPCPTFSPVASFPPLFSYSTSRLSHSILPLFSPFHLPSIRYSSVHVRTVTHIPHRLLSPSPRLDTNEAVAALQLPPKTSPYYSKIP